MDLLFTILEDDTYKLEDLLKNGADVNWKDTNGLTALHFACREYKPECAKILIKYGSKLESFDHNGYAPIHYTCSTGKRDLVDLLIVSNVDINLYSRHNFTPLFYAVDSGSLETVELLLKSEANVNRLCGEMKETVLHRAVESDNKKMINLLLSYGADPTTKNLDGRLPSLMSPNKEMKIRLDKYAKIFIDYSPTLFSQFNDRYVDLMKNMTKYLSDPKQFGKREYINEGKFARVYKTSLNGECISVKVFKTELKGGRLKLFNREVCCQLQCQHENLLQIKGYYLSSGECNEHKSCLVLEYCPLTLSSIMKCYQKSGLLGAPKVLGYCKSIAQGMRYLHEEKKIVHRDLKPSNILLAYNGTIKIADFGLCRFLDTEQENNSKILQEQYTLRVGTKTYMAPELFLQTQKNYTFSVDVYSYGLIMWAIMMCKPPLELYLLSKLGNNLPDEKIRLPDHNKYPKQLIDLMLLCIQKNPQNRPSFRKICEILDDIIL
ncbi:serine/threonine-protein kinase ulk3 [Anaeramoeba flamelloides]|uniref:Serine/threonine-protein kinase ulk3 n=1 Tax=Anaeramoeba flamelloides TaxID=1746091 RepID=A0ABQ8Y2W9_9EUKA|nr:serine/threonine-protein kinase ulk3 [Anaeramoeba flamelloides]